MTTDIKIADDVFAIIASIAANSVEGVAYVGDSITTKALHFIGTNSLKKGVVIEKDKLSKSVLVRITVVLKQNFDVRKVCESIQEKVKESIESMLDMKVKEVEVHVAKVDN